VPVREILEQEGAEIAEKRGFKAGLANDLTGAPSAKSATSCLNPDLLCELRDLLFNPDPAIDRPRAELDDAPHRPVLARES
jgi:hypothetical protein